MRVSFAPAMPAGAAVKLPSGAVAKLPSRAANAVRDGAAVVALGVGAAAADQEGGLWMSYKLVRAVALGFAICVSSGVMAGSTVLAAGNAKPAAAVPPEKNPSWLSAVAVQPLPVQLTAQQTKTSKYLIEPIKDEVYLTINHQAILWRSKLDPTGFVLTPQGISAAGSQAGAAGSRTSAAAGATPKAPAPRWLGGLFAALQAVAAGDFAALAKDFRLHSPAKGELIATPKAKELAAVIRSLTLSFSAVAVAKPASAQNLRLKQVTIASPHEQTVLSELHFVTDRP